MTTTELLKEYAENAVPRIPQEHLSVMYTFQRNLETENYFSDMKREGDKFPVFRLKNHHGKWIDSTEILKEGPMVVTFYRGGWCPYCNIELRGYQAHISEIEEKGATLVAISPEIPDASMDLMLKYNFDFNMLSDWNSKLARELGIVFTLPPEIVNIYQLVGVDLEKTQGTLDVELPIPATYIVDTDSTIKYFGVFVDHRKRIDPIEIISKL